MVNSDMRWGLRAYFPNVLQCRPIYANYASVEFHNILNMGSLKY